MTPQKTMIGSTILLLGLGVSLLFAEEPTPKPKPVDQMTIADVMQEAHKRPSQLLKKVATGRAADAEKRRLKAMYEALSKADPPQGSQDSWKEKTELLVDAADAAVSGKEDASEQLFKAANCSACHDEHK